MTTSRTSTRRGFEGGYREKDPRLPNTTPEELAKVLLRGGAKPRPETKRRKAS